MIRCLALVVLIVGCVHSPHSHKSWFEEDGKLHVLSTLAMIHDLVQEIGGDRIHAIPLIRGELDPHSYELVKGDDEKFGRADLIFYNGLGLEHGLSLRQHLEHNPKAVPVTAFLVKHHPEAILLVDGQYDPHVWMDIALWMHSVEPIVEALSEKDPEHAPFFRERATALLERMRRADEEIYNRLQSIPPEKRYLVTSHDAFNYFTRHYLALLGEEEWSVRCAAPEGLAPEAQMSVSDVLAIMEHVEKYRIKVLFPESNVNRDALKKIILASKEKGWEVRLCPHTLYGDSMGEALSYLDMIRHNATVIAEEFEK